IALRRRVKSVVLPVDHFVVWCQAFDAYVSRTPAPIALRKPVNSPRLTAGIKPNSRIDVPPIASATHTLLLLLLHRPRTYAGDSAAATHRRARRCRRCSSFLHPS
ncbi:unnamed protein product, partial [Ectocarpus sp. 12 AP-2014]